MIMNVLHKFQTERENSLRIYAVYTIGFPDLLAHIGLISA